MAESRHAPAVDEAMGDARENYRLLLVEDDDGDALLVTEQLRSSGQVDVQRAASLAEAERCLAEEAIDCVLLDLGLPDAVGLEAIERLLARDLPVALVVLTGDGDEQRGIEALGAGAQDYLVKGRIAGDALIRATRYAVERRAAEASRRELAVARVQTAENQRLQRGLLPDPIVDDRRIAVEAAYRPGGQRQLLGGDFYDVVQDDSGTVHAVVGDVCGHGPDEAALGVRMRMAWRTLILAGVTDSDLLATLDRVLIHERHREGVFTSLVTVSVDPRCCAAAVRIAGHAQPILVADEGCRLLDECVSGPVVGLGAPRGWPSTEVDLGDAWTIMLYTDGLYEGHIDKGVDRLGIEGLLELLDAHPPTASGNGARALDALIVEIERLNGGALTDDVAIVTLTCDASGS
jgi:serine phosphatase RsbU (regulator of sigma subunit)